MQYLQTINQLPEVELPGDLNPKNQTQLSDTASEEEELKRAEKADLVTLPDNVKGTNCGNCMYVNSDTFQCMNKDVDQKVTDRMCCALWDAVGTGRKWKQDKK